MVYRDIFVMTYTTHLEYIRIEAKGKEHETITRINPLLWHTTDSSQTTANITDVGEGAYGAHNMAMPVFDECI